MKFLSTLILVLVTYTATVAGDKFPYERLEKDNALLLIVDLQEGLYSTVRDFDPTAFKSNMALLRRHWLMTYVLTCIGANGPLPREILEMYPNSTIIERPGEVDAWDNKDFRDAVKATGKTQIILASIMTDVCTTHLALS
ncbi:Isochorismatase-like protein [Aspergillus bertholletiae]|uniref:Isochorismatase-like protein n=1 Tax=Aspergillus bertholletiae TaxID=1226010 RepID=A0A5N7BJB3_9EURO|nr:Isochorismatase-like protein [Aspergillus bertholletiae]